MTIKERYETETVSHSGLMALSKSPVTYRKYKEKEDDTSNKGMNLGSAIHCDILEPEEFSNRYLVSKYEIPSGKNAIFVEQLFKLRNSGDDTVSEAAIQSAFEASGLKGTAEKAWESYQGVTDSAKKLQNYWNYLLESEGKFKLSPSDADIISACKQSINNHKFATALINGYHFQDVYSELDIVWKHSNYDFKMRSIIDRLIIDEENKFVYVIDLKTTAKNVHDFLKAYEMYGYYRQLPLYALAAEHYCIEKGIELDADWIFQSYIVAVQTTGNHECAVFTPSQGDVIKGIKDNHEAMERMKWHFDNDKWEFPREYYEGDGVITLKIDEDSV